MVVSKTFLTWARVEKGNFGMVILYVADMAGIYISYIGKMFLCQNFSKAKFLYFFDSCEIDLFHEINLSSFLLSICNICLHVIK